ncbi:MAG: VCBS repeat-containing protein [Acidobacteria bacterium]|nr:VCBS repeat-containing protein [Acidobacteriota bacterium]
MNPTGPFLKPITRWLACAGLLICAGSSLVTPTEAQRKTPKPSAQRQVPFRHIIIDRHHPKRPNCKTVGDIDGDGFTDVLAASWAGEGVYWYAYPNWTKRRIDTGSFTTDMQTGDIDGDGDLDVVIPRDGTGLVWYENPLPKGNPATDKWTLHKIDDKGAHDLELGDIDRDRKLDVVGRHGETRVFLQKSPDEWVRIVIPTKGRGGTALGDLDGDGDLDIAQDGYWLEAPDDKVKGVWQRHEIGAGWPNDVGVHIADLNKDKRPDVILAPAEASGRLVWYEAADPKKGPWKEHVIAEGVSHLHTFKTADIDKDGNLDLVTAEMEQTPQGRVTIHYNLGKGLQWSAQVIGWSGSHNLRLADIGNDGDIDIVGANHGNYGGSTPVEMWENLSAKPAPSLSLDRWQRHVIDPDKPWRAVFIAPADLDGDAELDIVTGGWWYKNPGQSGAAWTRGEFGAPLNNMAAVYDFDSDGDLDVLGTQGQEAVRNADFVWARNDGQGSFTVLSNITKGDGDFLQGAAVMHRVGGPVEVALSWHASGKGIQLFTAPKNPSTDTWKWRQISEVSQDEELSVGDIGRDTFLDLLLGTKWLRNYGKSWALHTLNGVSGDPDRNRLADINGDGRLDAVVGFEAINKPGKLAWYEQPPNPTETWIEHMIGTPVGPMSLDVADMDRDGDLDIVVGEHNYQEPAKARLLIFENLDGKGGKWKEHIISTGDEHHDGAVVVDIDSDGDLDIISIGWSHKNVLLYENKAIGATAVKNFPKNERAKSTK